MISSERMTRRALLGAMGATGAVLLVGCGDSGGGDTDGGGSTGGSGATSGTVGSSGEDGSTGAPTTGSAECEGEATAWATGGTAAMTAKECYPDPFAGGVMACALICETTEGPCTADTMDRQDVSEGFPGLPVRLALLIVDADACAPVGGARVEIWHTQRTGVYSGDTPNPGMCSGGDADAPNHLYFRGAQTAGADGRVNFDTCFPGWYQGRAIHIHFRVYVGADAFATSQLFFDPALTQEIFAAHPDYAEFGQPDTSNDDDNIIGGEAEIANYTLTTARMPDGALLASKVIAVRGALGDPTCSVGGGGMPPP